MKRKLKQDLILEPDSSYSSLFDNLIREPSTINRKCTQTSFFQILIEYLLSTGSKNGVLIAMEKHNEFCD